MADTPVYPIAAGHPNYQGLLIPTVWSSRILEKFYTYTVFNEIANTDYEGEIKAYGNEVVIRLRPDIHIHEYVKGAPLKVQQPDQATVKLLIDQGFYWNVLIERVDEAQSDLGMFEEWTEDAAEQLKIRTDRNILHSVYADAAAANQGANAGAISGNINLGATGAGLSLTESNIIKTILKASIVLDEQDVPDADRWMVIPSHVAGLIKASELKDASVTGDMESTLRNGRLGMIDRWTLYRSNNLFVDSNGDTQIIFGHRSALTFAAQLLEASTIEPESAFGRLARGLQVYGFEVLKPEAMGRIVASAAFT